MQDENPIKKARIRAGFPSANQASTALGIGQALYNKYENGLRNPGGKNLVRLAAAFGCRVDHLLGVEPLPAAKPRRTKAAS